jgi:Flp pilus assembly protein TadD
MRFKLSLVMSAVVLAMTACASGGAPSRQADDQLGIGTKAAERGYWQEALFRFERADQARPDDAEILNNMAVALEALGRYDDALAAYKRALEISSKSTIIRRNYARFAEFFTSYARGVKPKEGADETR